MLRSTLFLLCLIGFTSQAQNTAQPPPCSATEAAEFNFWLGDWTATWGDTLQGSNHIEKIMDGCTVQENFIDPNAAYLGKSWTVYNANYKMWQQTWVDNHGGYIALTGGKVGDSMILTTAERSVPISVSATQKIRNRMVFFNIEPNSFDWNWEASTDGGKTWKINWHIKYRRK